MGARRPVLSPAADGKAMMRRLTLLMPVLFALVAAAVAPAAAQVVVLDDEVVLAERPRGGGGDWSTPRAVLPADQSALASELYSVLQSQPPLLPARLSLPSRATLDVTAYPSINRRTGLPCVGCRNPCRSFRYTYARPDRGSVTVEGQRCRRRNGQWVAFEPDTVVAQRPGAAGAPLAGAVVGAPPAEAMRRPAPTPPPLPPARPGDERAVAGIAGAGAAPSPFDPPLAGDGADEQGSVDDYANDAAIPPRPAEPRLDTPSQPLPGSADDVWSTAALPDVAPPGDGDAPVGSGDAPVGNVDTPVGEDDAPLVLSPPPPSGAVAAAEAALAGPAEPTETATPPPAAASVDAAAPPVAATTTEADVAGDVPPAPPEPVGATPTAPAAAPDAAVETQTARIVMPFGGGEQAGAVEVETTADPDVVRMLRMLRYLDPETSAEPSPQAYEAAVSDFASDERFALPQSNSALRERLEGAVDRLAALSSCPATSGDGYGACLTGSR